MSCCNILCCSCYDLGLKYETLNYFPYYVLAFQLFFIILISFSILQESCCLHFDCFFFVVSNFLQEVLDG
jgi:hypothetical protein